MRLNILDIPGYAEAVLRERMLRDAAFLGLSETVGPFELRPLTLRGYLVLQMARSPLLHHATPSREQLVQFLWAQSVDYKPGRKGRFARWLFMRKCRKHLATFTESARIIGACHAYIDEAMMDAPPRQRDGNYHKSYYSEVCFWVKLFEWHYTDAQVLDMPLKTLHQFRNAKLQSVDSKSILFNPSDREIAKHLERLNAEQTLRN